jgi:hypothetical protein
MKKLVLIFMVAFTMWGCMPLRSSPVAHGINLVVEKGEAFQLTGDSFLIDTLILNDGAGILLDKKHGKTVVRINYFRFGRDCFVDGIGFPGFSELVRTNTGAIIGAIGHSGKSGIGLLLYCAAIEKGGNLFINLNGGDGASGGSGGTDIARVASNPLTRGATANSSTFRVPLQSVAKLPSSNQYPRTTNGDGGNGGRLLLSIPEEYKIEFKQAIKISNEGGFSANENPSGRIQAAAGAMKVIVTKD